MQNDDRLMQAVANLRSITPDSEWTARVRARCHSEIAGRVSFAGRESRAKQSDRHPSPRIKLLDAVALAALCAYLSAVLQVAARLGGLL